MRVAALADLGHAEEHRASGVDRPQRDEHAEVRGSRGRRRCPRARSTQIKRNLFVNRGGSEWVMSS